MLFLTLLIGGASDIKFSDLVAGEPERIASELKFTEGPVWHHDGYLLFSDIPANTIYKLTLDHKLEVFRNPSGNSNGLALDSKGRLVACEHGNRRVSLTKADDEVITLAEAYKVKNLNSPNDLAIKSDGSIYFTDPPYGVQSDQRELDFQGVYKISPEGKISLLLDDFEKPNGLVFSPDEKVLYIADTARKHVKAFDVKPDGSLTNMRIFVDSVVEDNHGPDGMKVDENGNLYVAAGVTWIFDSSGNHIGSIKTPEAPANCAFGGPDNKTFFITARTSVYKIPMKVSGAKAIKN
ncbi:SMP-30/gluconolactonase/LRE family protein [Candidatus Poribacteria bacterium]|nr:SMP-30/gluconolactonase/LRE family protein [Candidatus Poribacteria bacterium]